MLGESVLELLWDADGSLTFLVSFEVYEGDLVFVSFCQCLLVFIVEDHLPLVLDELPDGLFLSALESLLLVLGHVADFY